MGTQSSSMVPASMWNPVLNKHEIMLSKLQGVILGLRMHGSESDAVLAERVSTLQKIEHRLKELLCFARAGKLTFQAYASQLSELTAQYQRGAQWGATCLRPRDDTLRA